MMVAALLLAITASSGPCETIAQKPLGESSADATRRTLIRFAPAENQTLTIYRVGRGDASVELTISADDMHHRHMRTGTRQAEIDGNIAEAIARINVNDCRAGAIVNTLRKLTRHEIDRPTAEKALHSSLGQAIVIGPAPNVNP